MQLRFLEYFIALADEKHFARAADRCNVTQPTLSAGIASLETLLGKRLVLRDRRFVDLTSEGYAVLPYARMLVASHEDMRQAINAAGPLQGELRLGTIPAAMPYLGRFVGVLRGLQPELKISIRQSTSDAIMRGIASFELDAGLTYLQGPEPTGVLAVALYEERYRFATRSDGPLGDRRTVRLAEAVAQPLCLLHRGMLNRRILDRHLVRLDLTANPVATSDSYAGILSMVAHGGLASIVTDSHFAFIGTDMDIILIEIQDLPEPNRVGLLVSDREPLAPIAKAAMAAAQASATLIGAVYQR